MECSRRLLTALFQPQPIQTGQSRCATTVCSHALARHVVLDVLPYKVTHLSRVADYISCKSSHAFPSSVLTAVSDRLGDELLNELTCTISSAETQAPMTLKQLQVAHFSGHSRVYSWSSSLRYESTGRHVSIAFRPLGNKLC